MEPLNTFLTKSYHVLSDLVVDKSEKASSKSENINAVIMNIVKRMMASDLNTIALSSAEFKPIDKLLRNISAKARKNVDSVTFKLFRSQIKKMRQCRDDFKKCEAFEACLNSFSKGQISGDKINQLGKLIVDNLSLCFTSKNKLSGGKKVEQIHDKLRSLSELVSKESKLHKLITRILPKQSSLERLPTDWMKKSLEMLTGDIDIISYGHLIELPAGVDVEESLNFILKETQGLHEGSKCSDTPSSGMGPLPHSR